MQNNSSATALFDYRIKNYPFSPEIHFVEVFLRIVHIEPFFFFMFIFPYFYKKLKTYAVC